VKDVTGKTLAFGQMVVTNLQGYTADLVQATVVGFTEKKIRLATDTPWEHEKVTTFLKFPEQVAIVSTNNNAEVREWRIRFPQYEYRPQDGCIALKAKYTFQD